MRRFLLFCKKKIASPTPEMKGVNKIANISKSGPEGNPIAKRR